MIKIIFFVLISESLNTVGHIFFKKTADVFETPRLREAATYMPFFRSVLRSPYIWFGLSAMAFALVAWLIALAQGDLSLVYSIGSLQYVLVLISSRIFLGEKINVFKITGTLLVMGGIILVSMSR